SEVIPQGRVGGAVALYRASRMIHEDGFPYAIVAGVDSYLVAGTLRAYDERERLLTPYNSDGFIPGEAGGALLVGPAARGGLICQGMGFAVEKATIESEEPLRADGMTAALKQALDNAGINMAEIGYRIADLSGEQYTFKEADLAVSRILRDRHDFQDLWHPADCIGESGAAAIPVMLSVALYAARKGYAAGNPILALSSNDDGRRAAMTINVGAKPDGQ
ncbi:MAG: hypothetical protein ACR2QH_17060, partial [Geminicoccaceae bacterium]